MYDVFICADDTSLVVSESEILGSNECAGTDILGNDYVSKTTLRAGAGQGATTVNFGVNYYGNEGMGEGKASGVSMACG